MNEPIVRDPPPPTHFQWREALFPSQWLEIVVPMYVEGEAGLLGRAYNFSVVALGAISWVLNLALYIPMMAVVILWGLVTIPITTPLHILALVRQWGPERPRAVGGVISYPGVVLIWLVTSPVKFVNLLTAIVVYLFGPKSAARQVNRRFRASWLRRLLSASDRRKAKAGKMVSGLLTLVGAAENHRVRAAFLGLTLQQKQEYQVRLLRHAGLESEAAAVEALRLEAPVRPASLSNVYLSVQVAAGKAIGTARQAQERKAATFAFVDAGMSVKHAELMRKKTWEENISTWDASREVLLEASRMVLVLIQMMTELRLLERDDADRRIEHALSEQADWIVGGFGQAL